MFKNFCIYFSLLTLFLFAALMSRTTENYTKGIQVELSENDRIVVCVNPDTLLPETTDCIKIDYTIPEGKIGETYSVINVVLR